MTSQPETNTPVPEPGQGPRDAGPGASSHFALLLAYCSAAGEAVRCPVCQYSLRGLTVDRCPECGAVLRLSLIASKSIGPAYTAGVVGLMAAIVFGLLGGVLGLLERSPGLVILSGTVTLGSIVASAFFDRWYWRRANRSRKLAWRAVGVIWLVALGIGAIGAIPLLLVIL
jgi:hypothetical protein